MYETGVLESTFSVSIPYSVIIVDQVVVVSDLKSSGPGFDRLLLRPLP